MAYDFEFDFIAEVTPSVPNYERIEVTGRRHSQENLISVNMLWHSHIDNRDVTMTTQFDSIAVAFDFIEAHRNLLASVAKQEPLAMRVEFAGLDQNGVPDPDFCYVITKDNSRELPYRIRENDDVNGLYIDCKDIATAFDKVRELNCDRTNAPVRQAVYDEGYRQTFYESADEGIGYFSRMEKPGEDGQYHDVPHSRTYAFSAKRVDDILNNIRIGRAEVENASLSLTEDQKMQITADVLFSDGRSETISTEYSFRDWVLRGNLGDKFPIAFEISERIKMLEQIDAMFCDYKSEFYYDKSVFSSLVSDFRHNLIILTNGAEFLSPEALSKLMELNPTVQEHYGSAPAIERKKQHAAEVDR